MCYYQTLTTRSSGRRHLYIILKGFVWPVFQLYDKACSQVLKQGSSGRRQAMNCAMLSNPRWVRQLDATVETRNVFIDFSNFAHGLWKHLQLQQTNETIMEDLNLVRRQMTALLDNVRSGVVRQFGPAKQPTPCLVTLPAPPPPLFQLLIYPSSSPLLRLFANYSCASFAPLPPSSSLPHLLPPPPPPPMPPVPSPLY